MSQEELADISEHSSGIREELRRLRRECFICKIKYNMAGHGLIPCPAIILVFGKIFMIGHAVQSTEKKR